METHVLTACRADRGHMNKKMETRVRAVRGAASRAELGGGNAWSGCLPHGQAAQERKMET